MDEAETALLTGVQVDTAILDARVTDLATTLDAVMFWMFVTGALWALLHVKRRHEAANRG